MEYLLFGLLLVISWNIMFYSDVEVKILIQDGGLFQNLTERERIVCHYLAMGLSNKEIAHNMNIAFGTVKVYIHNIICKTGLRDRTQIALKWIDRN